MHFYVIYIVFLFSFCISLTNEIMVFLRSLVVLFEIVARLPPKFVTRCKLVCGEWLEVLSSEEFVMIHCKYMRRSVDQKILLTNYRTCKVCSLNPHSISFVRATNVRIPFNAKPHNLLFLASLDGMLCVCVENTCELVV